MNLRSAFLIVVGLAIVVSCAPERNNVLSNSFHNTTAHYNAYFIANEHIKEIESIIEERYEWNYNLVLPVFPQFDSTVANSYTTQIEDCIQKASLAITRHKGSNWEDDSYNLVGKARYYSLDFPNAIETFKYVNTKGESDHARHEALVSLMRVFVENFEYNNAIAVSDYLKKEQLNKKNLKNLYLTRGYLHQRRVDYNSMVQNLIQAEPLITNPNERARINFIIAQVYQHLGFDGEAYNFYRQTLKSNPHYELSFYTKLNMAQVTQLAKTNDAKKIRKYFTKLLKDKKNEDFKDKIYYEMGQFEVRHGNLELGIEHYKSSIRSSKNNRRQKSHSYWALGKIYYDSLANYKLAAAYYDSTIQVMPKDEIEYEAIQARKEILDNFVKQWTIIQTNDSLLNLAALSSDSLDRFLDVFIAQKEAEAKEDQKKKKRQQRAQLASTTNSFGQDRDANFGSGNYQGSVWYFYSQTAIQNGIAEFKQKWGDRPLEDNWRRSNKAAQANQTDDPEVASAGNRKPNSKNEEPSEAETESEFKVDREKLIAGLPKTAEEKQKLLDELEEASYQLGKIYYYDLVEKQNATETFEDLVTRFPESEYRYEVMYFLYLLFADLGNEQKSEFYKNLILEEAPNSIYAKTIINPNYSEEANKESEQMKQVYAVAYEHYRKGDFKEALNLIYDAQRDYPDNDFVDNMDLLRILVLGKSESVYKYQYELKNFTKTYSESELVPYVDSLIYASEQFQINLVNSSKAKFIPIYDRASYFVFAYETDQELSDELPDYFTSLIEPSSNLKVGNLLLDDKYSMILVSEFNTKKEAVEFNEKVKEENPSEKINKSGNFYNFVITIDNFNILYQTKELDTYLKFYRKNY